MNMKNLLLKILNWLNDTPAHYGFINNKDAFSKSFLEESARAEPDITLSQFMKEMELMNNCGENCVIENGESREMTSEDVEDLQRDFNRQSVRNEIKNRQK